MPRGRPPKRRRIDSNTGAAVNQPPGPSRVDQSSVGQPSVRESTEMIVFAYNKLKYLETYGIFGNKKTTSLAHITAEMCGCSLDRVFEVVPQSRNDSKDISSLRQLKQLLVNEETDEDDTSLFDEEEEWKDETDDIDGSDDVVTDDESVSVTDDESVSVTDDESVSVTDGDVVQEQPEAVTDSDLASVNHDEPDHELVAMTADMMVDIPAQPDTVTDDESVSVIANERLSVTSDEPMSVTADEVRSIVTLDQPEKAVTDDESDSVKDDGTDITDDDWNSEIDPVLFMDDQEVTTLEDESDSPGEAWRLHLPSPPIERMQPVVWWDDDDQARYQRLDLNDVEMEQLHKIVFWHNWFNERPPSVAQVMDKMRTEMEETLRHKSQQSLLAALYAAPGFNFPKTMSGERCVTETWAVRTTHAEFLRAMCNLTGDSRPVVYVADTWLEPDALGDVYRHGGQHSMDSAVFNERVGPFGRMLLCAAASYQQGLLAKSVCGKGFRPGAQVDCEDDLQPWFQNWFEGLCKMLTDQSVIVVDAGPHHWVVRHLPHSSKTLSNYIYELDIIARNHGHQLLCAPQFHSQYNPLQQLMTDAKRQVLASIYSWKLQDMWKILGSALLNCFVGGRNWQEKVKLSWYACNRL